MKNCYILFLVISNLTVYLSIAVKTCPEQYQTYENGNKCFSFLPSRAQWITAEQACQQNDGKLATIDNGFDEVFISSQAFSFYATYADNDVWIGLNNLVDSDNYQWTDGATPKYTDWGKGQPLTQGPYCVSQTFKNGSNLLQYWSSQSCFDFKFFVCEWNGNLTDPSATSALISTTTTTSTISTTTTTLKPTTTKMLTTEDPTTILTEAYTNAQTTVLLPENPTTTFTDDETSPPISSPMCDYDFTFNYQDGRCYKVLDPRSITDQDYEGGCHQYNGHLPSIHSLDTNDYIANLVANAPSNLKDPKGFGILIGFQLINNIWQWTDGTSNKDFLHWNQGPTIGTNCSVIITDPDDHLWDSINCIQPISAYVCYNLPRKGSI